MLHRLGEGRAARVAERELEPPGRRPDVVEIGGGRHAGGDPHDALELEGRLLRLVDAGEVLREPELHQLRAQLLELTAAGALLCQLAERGDRGRTANEVAARHRPSVGVEGEPGAAALARVRTQIHA